MGLLMRQRMRRCTTGAEFAECIFYALIVQSATRLLLQEKNS